mmetsp:Transcript_5511/g.10495  ORF Transcript_5511/g.10495 Transcript_5511/m.10495 type:complete len:88 (-) Transcript_5511:92-355(-)
MASSKRNILQLRPMKECVRLVVLNSDSAADESKRSPTKTRVSTLAASGEGKEQQQNATAVFGPLLGEIDGMIRTVNNFEFGSKSAQR